MLGEMDIQKSRSKKFTREVWTVTIANWDLTDTKERRNLIKRIKKLNGFVGWCNPERQVDGYGCLYFALFDTEEHGIAAVNALSKDGVTVGKYSCRHYAEKEVAG